METSFTHLNIFWVKFGDCIFDMVNTLSCWQAYMSAKCTKFYQAKVQMFSFLPDSYFIGQRQQLCFDTSAFLSSLKENITIIIINCPYCHPLNLVMMQDLMHHMGLYMAKSRGAKIVDRIILEE